MDNKFMILIIGLILIVAAFIGIPMLVEGTINISKVPGTNNGASGTISADEFNSKFTTHAGNNVRATAVISLMEAVETSNQEGIKTITIEYNGDNYFENTSGVSGLIDYSDLYSVQFGYDTEGYINKVIVNSK